MVHRPARAHPAAPGDQPGVHPKAIGQLRHRVTTIVEAVLDELTEIGPGIRYPADVGYPVTLAAIAELLDVGIEVVTTSSAPCWP